MKLSYKKLWVILVKICEALNCDISDIAEIVPDEVAEAKNNKSVV